MNTLVPSEGQTSIDDFPADSFTIPAGTLKAGEAYSFSRSVSRTVDPENVSESIERVYDHATEAWKMVAKGILRRLCETRREFDLDDLADALSGIHPPAKDNRATGQLLKNAVKDGWCGRSGVRNSKRKSRHYGYIAVYESLIHSPSVL